MPEEDQLLLLTSFLGKDEEADEHREGLLARTSESVRLRYKQLLENGDGKRPDTESLTLAQVKLCYQWRHLKAPREPMHWLQGDPVEPRAWEPAPGDVHLIVVGDNEASQEFRFILLGAAQVDLAASAALKGVEVALMSDQATWRDHLRKGVNRTLAQRGAKAPRNFYRNPGQLRTNRALVLGPEGFLPEHLGHLPAQLSIVAVTVAPTDIDVTLMRQDPNRRVTRFNVTRLNETLLTLPLTWRDLAHLPPDGTVLTSMPDVAIRFADAYAHRHGRLPNMDDVTLRALLAPQSTATVVGLLMTHFQSLLRQHLTNGKKAEQQDAHLTLRLVAPPDGKTARWLSERAMKRTRLYHVDEKYGKREEDG